MWTLESAHRLEEKWNLADWSYVHVAAASAFVLFLAMLALGERGGIRWHSLVHAVVTGYLSLACVYLNYQNPAAHLCEGTPTSFHLFVPAITLGYGAFDMFEAMTTKLGKDFLLHGTATISVMAYFCQTGFPEIVLPFLLMEISTVHLVFMKATFLSERVVFVNMVLFVATFFLFRLMVCPYIWWGIARQALSHSPDNACLPWHLKYATVGFGMTFNLLNSYWGYKVLRKFLRKLAGKEAVKQDNALKDI